MASILSGLNVLTHWGRDKMDAISQSVCFGNNTESVFW